MERQLRRMKQLQPVIIEPILVPKVWGGRSLESELEMDLPEDTLIGEAWLVFDRPSGSSKFRDTSTTLRDWMEHSPEGLLGTGVPPTENGSFPLMLKILDANARLSVQCHPDASVAARRNHQPKTEAWVVLGKRKGGRIIYGFKPNVSRLQAVAALNTPEIEEMLNSYQPEVGDCIYVPPGTVHSPGPGVTLFEVQQNSETTYRMYDWGRDRELHLEASIETMLVAHPSAVVQRPTKTDDGGEWLVQNEHFELRRYSIQEQPKEIKLENRFMIITLTSGRASITWQADDNSSAIVIRQGETVLIPAIVEKITLHPSGTCKMLMTTPGRN